MIEPKRKTLMERLRAHDWYYAYSDDNRYYQSGRREEQLLNSALANLGCPYNMKQLRMAVQNMVVEEFEEESPGEWYKQPRKYKSVAPVTRGDLIHRADQVQILAWIEHSDRELYE